MRVREDGNVPMHWHNFFEFDFIDGGHCRQVLNGAGTGCGKGALTVLCSSDFHAYRIDPEKGEFMSTYSFHFDGHFPDSETLRLLGSLSGKQIDCSGDGTFSAVKDEFVMLFSETGNNRPERDAMVRNIIARITLLAFRACGSGTAKCRRFTRRSGISRRISGSRLPRVRLRITSAFRRRGFQSCFPGGTGLVFRNTCSTGD